MSWNYRIVRYKDGSGYGLHEVYYSSKGKPRAMSQAPATFIATELLDLHESIRRAAEDALNRPIFEEPKKWTS